VTMPPTPMNGVRTDLSEIDLATLVEADSVYNHELSWMSFNWRVLAMSLNHTVPVYERLRFLAITAKNLDEFFAKRVGGLKRQQAAGVANLVSKKREYLRTPSRQLELIAEACEAFVRQQTETLMDDVLPELRNMGIHLYNYYELEDEDRTQLREWFVNEVEPLLTPLAIDPGHPFPYLTSLAVNMAIVLKDPEDPDQSKSLLSIVNLPPSMQRWVKLPDNKETGRRNAFVPLEHVVIYNLDRLFGGMEIQSVNCFRATRNADVVRNEEEAEDLLEMMTDEVRERRFAPFVRLEVNENISEELVMTLTTKLNLTASDVYYMRGPLGVGDLFSLPVEFGMDSHLMYKHWAPLTHISLAAIKQKREIFKIIRTQDILVHHPYQSFATSTQLLVEAAATDPKVVAIKCTLYRTSSDSPIIDALIKAAEHGVQVAVLVELKARFDEARNVGFANKLEDAGCNVAYGLVGLKTHCKTTLVIRQEAPNILRTYCHIGTGNYNPSTAAVYTDYGLLTCDPDLGKDVMDLFKYLTGYHRQQRFRRLLVAPTSMRQTYMALIDQEIRNAQAGMHAEVTCKVNGIDDPVVTSKLYEASQAGVKVNLIVRGICRVRPKVPGFSDNIRIVSVIGRFLEHHRVVRYENGGNPKYFIGSADWMTRNLMRRVEVATPILDKNLQKEVDMVLQACMNDAHSWEMQADGRYVQTVNSIMLKTIETFGEAGEIADDTLQDEDDLPERATQVGVQMALMECYKLQRKKHKKKSRKASQVVRRTKRRGKRTFSAERSSDGGETRPGRHAGSMDDITYFSDTN